MTDDVEILRFVPTWYVVFSGPEHRRFFVDWFTEPGFRHCMAFGFDAGANRWMIYDVTRVGTAVLAVDTDGLDAWLTDQRKSGARVLKVDMPEKVRPRNWLQIGLWCTIAVIHLVGVRSSAWRPSALWRDLVRDGAEEAFGDNGLVAAANGPVSSRQ